MSDLFSRRTFMGILPGLAVLPSLDLSQDPAKIAPTFPKLNPDMVQEIVMAAHSDLNKVKELVGKSAALVRCSYDWGFGDWEGPVGAAAHMGRRDIAEYLIANGARADIFTFAMMGDLATVKAMIAGVPGIQKVRGPHGITLLAHARIGGEPAKPVLEYLESLGDANPALKMIELTDAQKEVYLGRYEYGSAPNEALEVIKNARGQLNLKVGEGFARGLGCVEEHLFVPSGAPETRVRFQVEAGKAISLTIHDPALLVSAKKS